MYKFADDIVVVTAVKGFQIVRLSVVSVVSVVVKNINSCRNKESTVVVKIRNQRCR